MKKIRVTYFALAAFFSVVSCSKGTTEPDVYDWSDGKILIKPAISEAPTSRAQDMTLDSLKSFQVTCFNASDIRTDEDGNVIPYFYDAPFVRSKYYKDSYESSPDVETLRWPTLFDQLKFIAFSPSCTDMAKENSIVSGNSADGFFKLVNNSEKNGAELTLGYRLENISVNRDISRQFDFVTAQAEGNKKDFSNGVILAFRHQMSRVELKAWGASKTYHCEIAGVCLGNPVVKGTFIFADPEDAESSERWINNTEKDRVDYKYAGKGVSLQEGDRIFHINGSQHNSSVNAESIMGKGGCAMVVPTLNGSWEGVEDPDIGVTPYKTDKMYFSVLLRIIDSRDADNQVYPYPGNPDNMTVIRYAVDADDNIVCRLYRGSSEGVYFTDPNLRNRYVQGEDETIKEFGWAAIPVSVNWEAGKSYVYTLDYTNGVGLHDPRDPKPGTPIIGREVAVKVSVEPWDSTENPTEEEVPGN